MKIPPAVLQAYKLNDTLQVDTLVSGLINNTWKITDGSKVYILQRINDTVFKKPWDIAANVQLIAEYLATYCPTYKFVSPLSTTDGKQLIYSEGELPGYFRLFPFVHDSHSKAIADTPGPAYEAAKQFGRFTKFLAGFRVSKLNITIPCFHDLSYRYKQFLEALEKGNLERISEAETLISTVKSHTAIVSEFESLQTDPAFKKRVTHHDTKISNVLFNEAGEGLCVIDLDTVMPGYFISDVGDMMRTYLTPVSEEEKDFSRIEVRDDFYHAIVKGYYDEMKDELTIKEKTYFFFSGKFMIYMQALRFLTDHLNNDVYYGASYPGHNFVRAGNQMVLLQRLIEKESILLHINS